MKYGIYPYSDNDFSLVEYLIKNNKLSINAVIYPRSWNVHTDSLLGINSFSDFDEALKTTDGLVILQNNQYKLTVQKIKKAIIQHKDVICCMQLKEPDLLQLKSEAAKEGTLFDYIPKENAEIKQKIEERTGYFLTQECVVIAIGAISEGISTSELTLDLTTSFTSKGYNVTSIVSDVNLELCGFERLLPYQLKGVENDPSQFIYDLNVYINYLQMKHQSDVILLQLPQEGMFRVYNNLPFGFGVKPYLVSQAVDVDYSIIVSGVEIYDSEIYKKISACFENRYGFAIDAVVVSERTIDYSLSLQNSEMTYKAVPDDAVDSCVKELLTGKTDILYCRNHEKNLGEKIAEHCIDRLSQNTAQF